MTKRKAQIDIKDYDADEEVLPQVGKINTPEEILERKILTIRGPKLQNQANNVKITINAPKPTFNSSQPEAKTQDMNESIELIKKGLLNNDLSFLPKYDDRPIVCTPIISNSSYSMEVPEFTPMPCFQRSNSIKSEADRMFGNLSKASLPQSLEIAQSSQPGIASPVIFHPNSDSVGYAKRVKLATIPEESGSSIFKKSLQQSVINGVSQDEAITIEIRLGDTNKYTIVVMKADKELYKGVVLEKEVGGKHKLELKAKGQSNKNDEIELEFKNESELQEANEILNI